METENVAGSNISSAMAGTELGEKMANEELLAEVLIDSFGKKRLIGKLHLVASLSENNVETNNFASSNIQELGTELDFSIETDVIQNISVTDGKTKLYN